MSIFGWDFPPGVSESDIPGNRDCLCEICGQDTDICECPECPVCEEFGDPNCYLNHGLKRTEEQKFLKECSERKLESEYRYYLENNACFCMNEEDTCEYCRKRGYGL